MRVFLLSSSLLFAATSCSGFVVVQPSKHSSTLSDATTYAPRSHLSSLHSAAQSKSWTESAKTVASGILVASTIFFNSIQTPQPAWAESARIVGAIQGSGLVFKDTLQIESFEDPKVRGVTLYISNFQRPLTERLTSNFLADPSYAAVACAKTGSVSIADNIAKGKAGEQVFDESRSLFFKTLRVQRIYDEEKNTVVYVSYSTRIDKNDDSNKSRFKSSLCAVNLDSPTVSASPPAAPPTTSAPSTSAAK